MLKFIIKLIKKSKPLSFNGLIITHEDFEEGYLIEGDSEKPGIYTLVSIPGKSRYGGHTTSDIIEAFDKGWKIKN